MKRPNLFLIGHPRSGTGSIDGYLQNHPEIFMGAKELHYFGSDLFYNSPARSFENYIKHFDEAQNHRYIGESSTWYLSSSCAAQEIKKFSPDAKVLISLRNPVDWIHSLHSHMYYATYDDTPSFVEALKKEPQRLAGDLPPNAHPPIGVCYKSLVQYAKQVHRYFDVFGKENVHVVIFDELKSHPQKTLNEIFSFLKLSIDSLQQEPLQGSKKQRNANHIFRSRRLHMWLKHGRVRSYLQGTRPEPIWGLRKALWGIHQLNTTEQKRPPLDPALRRSLTKEFTKNE